MNGWCLRTELNSCVCVSNWPMHNSSTTTAAINKTDWHWNLTRSRLSPVLAVRRGYSLCMVGNKIVYGSSAVVKENLPGIWRSSQGSPAPLRRCHFTPRQLSASFIHLFIHQTPWPDAREEKKRCVGYARTIHASNTRFLVRAEVAKWYLTHMHLSYPNVAMSMITLTLSTYVNSRRKWKVHTHIHNSSETVSVFKTHWANWHPYTKRCFDAQAVQSRCFTICAEAVKTLGCAGARLNPTMRWRLGSAGC